MTDIKPNVAIRLSVVGDIALNGGYWGLVPHGKAKGLAPPIARLIGETDIAIGNLEGPLTTCNSAGPPWRFGLHGHPAYAPILQEAGIQVVSLANNHAMDHGWVGLQETLRHLKSSGIRYVG